MPLPNFTIAGNLREILKSPTVGGDIAEQVWDDAYVILASNIEKPAVVVWNGVIYPPPPPMKATVDPVTGNIEIDDKPPQGLANDPGLNVTGIQWRCDIKTSTANIITSFWFDAAADGGLVNLGTVAHVPPLEPHPVSAISINDLITLINDEDSSLRPILDAAVLAGLTADAEAASIAIGAVNAKPAVRAPQPVVVFTFDDASTNDYNLVRGIFASKGVKAGFAIPTSFPGGGTVQGYPRMTWDQVRQLEADGHEILAHSVDHSHLGSFGSMNDAATLAQVNTKAAFVAQNIKAPRGFVYPFGEHDEALRKVVRTHFDYALGVTTGNGASGSQQPLRTFAIRRQLLNDTTVTATHYAEIDAAIANGEILVYLTHSGSELASTGPQRLADVIQYALDHNVPVVTPSQAFDMVRNVIDMGDRIAGKNFFVVDGRGNSYTPGPNRFGSAATVTVASSTPVVLTRDSNTTQIITGSTGQVFTLPPDVPAGRMFVFINKSSANVSANVPSGTNAASVPPGGAAIVVSVADNPTTQPDWTAQQIGIFQPSLSPSPFTVAVRDAQGNISVDAILESTVSTPTAGGTLTLTNDSVANQVFTGSAAHTLVLPSAVPGGRTFTVMNTSTGSITVQASDGSLIATVAGSQYATFTSSRLTPTTAAHWATCGIFPFTGMYFNVAGSPYTVPQRDGNGALWAKAMVPALTSQATSGSTTTLTANSSESQVFTGSSTQTCVLPSSGIQLAGWRFTIINRSTGAITVNSSAGDLVKTIPAGASSVITALQATPTAGTHWYAT